MASINDRNRANDWSVGGIRRRDFRADHGSGPEEMPHRPKRRKGKKCKRSKDGNHDFTAKAWYPVWRQKWDSEKDRWKWAQVPTEIVVCARCSKRKDRFIW